MQRRIWTVPKICLQKIHDYYETWFKLANDELLIFTKFCNDWVKIVDFVLKGYFWVSPDSPLHSCYGIFM